LINGTAKDQLGAEIDVDWAIAGLCMTMTMPPGSFTLGETSGGRADKARNASE
jgi:hypothetical protein